MLMLRAEEMFFIAFFEIFEMFFLTFLIDDIRIALFFD